MPTKPYPSHGFLAVERDLSLSIMHILRAFRIGCETSSAMDGDTLDPADYRGEMPESVGTKMPVTPVLQGENRKKLLERLYSEVMQPMVSVKIGRALEHSLSLPHGMNENQDGHQMKWRLVKDGSCCSMEIILYWSSRRAEGPEKEITLHFPFLELR